MSLIKSFQISVSHDKLERLRQKLTLADFPNDNDASWSRGPPVNEIQRLTRFWLEDYNWRDVEARLNELPHFIVQVEVERFGVFDVHCIHKRSSRSDAVPLLFLHGWPGSFLEVTKMIDDLVKDNGEDGVSFHVVAPSLIDFGFSSASPRGFHFEQHAEAYHNLMQVLGYEKYVIEAGDVGGLVSRFIAMRYGSTSLLSYHTNTPAPSQPQPETHPELYSKLQSTPLTAEEQQGLASTSVFSGEGSGYYKQLSSRPLTIGFALRDSPVALLAWQYEKMRAWSDGYSWTDEEIITWVSIYYFSTAGPEACASVYYAMENREDGKSAFEASAKWIDVPLGISRFSNDLILLPKLWNHTMGPIVYEAEYEKGGHFAAWERPDAIVKDLRTMFGKGGPTRKYLS